jgi:hypothetical protein
MPNYMQGVKGALKISWGTPPAGLERQALDHLEQFLGHLNTRAAAKEFEAPQFYISTTCNASKEIAMIVLHGDMETLYGLLFEQEFQQRITLLSSVAQNFTTSYYVAGAMAENARKVYGAAAAQLRAG